MQKMTGKSVDLEQENIDKIKELFPSTLTEGKIDFDKLRLILGDEVENAQERYQFTWNGKADAIKLAQSPSSMTLRPVKEDSKDWDTTENLYIEGDNLEVLKQLQKTYHNKIKVIYIDPPYNTGNDFVYNDKFANTEKNYKEKTNQGLVSNPETSGRYHSDWLNMIYPRLLSARNLLHDDGVIFISIDENEKNNLKAICDEIFGERNYITSFVWEKTQHFGRQKLNFYSNAEYILTYGKKIFSESGALKELLVESINTELEDAPLYNASNNTNSIVFPPGTIKFNIDDGVYKESEDNKYEIIKPVEVKDGTNKTELNLKFKSRWSQRKVDEELKKGCTFWVKSNNFAIRAIYGEEKKAFVSPKQIIFTNRSNPMVAINEYKTIPGTTEQGSRELGRLFNNSYFSYPKPVSLIEYLLSMIWNESKEGYCNDCIVLDFFAGSSTTAQAVMNLNVKDSGRRKFIMVQLPEEVDENSEAYKAGLKNISEISKERIRLSGEQILTQQQAGRSEDIDTGFKVFKVDSSNLNEWDGSVKYLEGTLDRNLAAVFKEDRSSEDVVHEIMLKYGVFDSPMKIVKVNGVEMFDVGSGYMLICLEPNINIKDIQAIGEQGYMHVIFNDESFSDDNVKMNALHTLKNMGVEEVVSI